MLGLTRRSIRRLIGKFTTTLPQFTMRCTIMPIIRTKSTTLRLSDTPKQANQSWLENSKNPSNWGKKLKLAMVRGEPKMELLLFSRLWKSRTNLLTRIKPMLWLCANLPISVWCRESKTPLERKSWRLSRRWGRGQKVRSVLELQLKCQNSNLRTNYRSWMRTRTMPLL